jgi:hypothetical protein
VLKLSFGHVALVGGCCVGKKMPQMSCYSAVQERRDEQEMFKLQDRTALIPDVRNRTLTLIKREDDNRSWSNFLIYFSHNVMPT